MILSVCVCFCMFARLNRICFNSRSVAILCHCCQHQHIQIPNHTLVFLTVVQLFIFNMVSRHTHAHTYTHPYTHISHIALSTYMYYIIICAKFTRPTTQSKRTLFYLVGCGLRATVYAYIRRIRKQWKREKVSWSTFSLSLSVSLSSCPLSFSRSLDT